MSARPLSAPARVWIFHHVLFHYRLAFWDRLADRGAGRYEIQCFGETEDGAAVGGGRRSYLTHTPVTGGLGAVGYTFVGARERIAAEQPEVVMAIPNPRNRLSWQIPGLCRSYGGVSVLWSKVHSRSGLPVPLLRAMKKRVYLPYDLAFTYGPQSTRELIDLGFPAERIYTAHNTVDTSRIFEQRAELVQRGLELRAQHGLGGKTLLLCIAKLTPQKRHADLLAAWPELRKLDPNLVLVLIGRGPLEQSVKRQASAIDPERIRFLGGVPEGEDYAWMVTADATIQCGAVGLAVNQSLASGTPAIIADEAGADCEILVDGVTGWRYQKGNVRALVDKVRAVLGASAERARITTEAVRFMREEASIERMVEAADACLTAALELRARRQPEVVV